MFNFLLTFINPLLFFFLLFNDDPKCGVLEEDASVVGFEGFSLDTTILLLSDVLMTRFSLGMDWSIL